MGDFELNDFKADDDEPRDDIPEAPRSARDQIGRASCRERV